MSIYLITIVVYILIMLLVGARKAGSVRSQKDFALAGRRLSTFVLVGTLLATWIGTGSIFGNAEETYRVGIAAFVIPFSEVFGIVALVLLAARVRRVGQTTVQDLLEIRYGALSRIFGAITLVMAYVIIVSYQYRAGAAVIERLLPASESLAPVVHAVSIIGVALVVILYTALAGMFSVAYTDVANGILMTLGIGLALPFAFFHAGGWEGIHNTLSPGHFDFFGPYHLADYIGILLPTFLLLLGDANMYTRFFSAYDPHSARRSAMWLLLGAVLLESAIIALAFIGSALHPGLANPAHVIVEIAFHSLPAPIGALLVATIIAVIVSTADSYLLSPSSALVRDVYQRFICPDALECRLVAVSRGMVVVLGLVALALAFTSDRFFKISLFAYTIYGVGITPPLIAAFLWKRANAPGAIASTLTGVIVALIWRIGGLSQWEFTIFDVRFPSMDAVIPAFVMALLALIVVSLFTAPPQEESWRRFFQTGDECEDDG